MLPAIIHAPEERRRQRHTLELSMDCLDTVYTMADTSSTPSTSTIRRTKAAESTDGATRIMARQSHLHQIGVLLHRAMTVHRPTKANESNRTFLPSFGNARPLTFHRLLLSSLSQNSTNNFGPKHDSASIRPTWILTLRGSYKWQKIFF
jgi:hypothetical protein